MILTYLLIAISVIVSIAAWQNNTLMNKLIFYPPSITHNNEWYRFITSGLIHADYGHLIFNMLSLYSFGRLVETAFHSISGNSFLYLIFYVTALIVSMLPSYFQNKENSNYYSLGASGAVSAVVFASILLDPMSKIYIYFLPIGIPAFLFGILFIIISIVLQKRGGGHINHLAHIVGGVYGLFFLFVLCTAKGIPIFSIFLQQIGLAH